LTSYSPFFLAAIPTVAPRVDLIYSTYGTAIKNSEGKDGSREKGEEKVTDRFLRRNNTMTKDG
jgi:hypothetical protein